MQDFEYLSTDAAPLAYKGDEGHDFEIDFGVVDEADKSGDIVRESAYEIGEKVKVSIGHVYSDADESKVAGIAEITGRRGNRMICKGRWLDTPLGRETAVKQREYAAAGIAQEASVGIPIVRGGTRSGIHLKSEERAIGARRVIEKSAPRKHVALVNRGMAHGTRVLSAKSEEDGVVSAAPAETEPPGEAERRTETDEAALKEAEQRGEFRARRELFLRMPPVVQERV